MSEAINAIYYAYQRHSVMADINYLTRSAWYLSNDYYTTSSDTVKQSEGSTILTSLNSKVTLLNTIQFQTSQAQMTLENRKGSSMSSYIITQKSLLSNGEVKSTQTNFTDTLNVYIAEAGALASTSLNNFDEDLSTSTSITSTKSYFYFVDYNGIYPLRSSSESMATEFYNFYYNEVSRYQTIFLVIMIIAIVVLVISQVFLLPIVFSVQRTNAIVLSFFAIVPVEEIQYFANQCESFLRVFIEKKQFGSSSLNDDKSDTEKQQNQNQAQNTITAGNNNKTNNKTEVFVIANEDIYHHPPPQTGQLTSKRGDLSFKGHHPDDSLNQSYAVNQSNLGIMYNQQEMGLLSAQAHQTNSKLNAPSHRQFNQANPSNLHKTPQKERMQEMKVAIEKAEKAKEEEEQKIENEENQRQKILNAKDHRKKYIVIQFVAFTLLIMVYFIILYAALEVTFENNIKQLLQHTQTNRIRSSVLKYYQDILQEGLVNLSPILEDGSTTVTLQSDYTQRMQENDDEITSTFKMSFPSQFSTYVTNFNNLNYVSVCEYTSAVSSSLACSDVSALSNGLQRVVTQIGVDGNTILADTLDYSSSSSTMLAYTNSILEGSAYVEIENMMVFVSPTIDILNQSFMSQYSDYLSFKSTIDKLCFSLFIVFIVLIFIFIWTPYLAALIQKIWMTKGVLNMIPIEIILKHEKLRQAFTAGDILSAVK